MNRTFALPEQVAQVATATASVGERRTKLQLLHPIAGRIDSPLSDAAAGWAESTAATARPAIIPTVTVVTLIHCGHFHGFS
jgi:hypothetical protein